VLIEKQLFGIVDLVAEKTKKYGKLLEVALDELKI
jgi:hypothetical protein